MDRKFLFLSRYSEEDRQKKKGTKRNAPGALFSLSQNRSDEGLSDSKSLVLSKGWVLK